jgi:tripartite-type tricarboxylate transporter receptor subunit TctC
VLAQQVPTLKELGPGVDVNSPCGLAGPAGLPARLVHVLHDAIRSATPEPAHGAERRAEERKGLTEQA